VGPKKHRFPKSRSKERDEAKKAIGGVDLVAGGGKSRFGEKILGKKSGDLSKNREKRKKTRGGKTGEG